MCLQLQNSDDIGIYGAKADNSGPPSRRQLFVSDSVRVLRHQLWWRVGCYVDIQNDNTVGRLDQVFGNILKAVWRAEDGCASSRCAPAVHRQGLRAFPH